jgi:hypothetical protein
MIILRLSAHRSASLMPGPEKTDQRALSQRVRSAGKIPTSLRNDMSGLLHMTDGRWEHPRGAGGGRLGRGIYRPIHGAATRLWLSFIRWQIRRLERRMAALEVDDQPMH